LNKKLTVIIGQEEENDEDEANLMTKDEIQQDDDDGKASNRNLNDHQQHDRLDKENNPLPENISEYIQKARDELKQYEEQKKFYEKRRKREIVLELVDLLEEHDYPREWLRLIIAQELGDYISTSYIEKILSERYPDEKKKIKEQSIRQITEIPQNDGKIPIEVSVTGESIGDDDHLDNTIPNSYDTDHKSSEEARTEFKTDLELQAEEGTRDIVRTLQKQVSELQTKCYLLDQQAQERSM